MCLKNRCTFIRSYSFRKQCHSLLLCCLVCHYKFMRLLLFRSDCLLCFQFNWNVFKNRCTLIGKYSFRKQCHFSLLCYLMPLQIYAPVNSLLFWNNCLLCFQFNLECVKKQVHINKKLLFSKTVSFFAVMLPRLSLQIYESVHLISKE